MYKLYLYYRRYIYIYIYIHMICIYIGASAIVIVSRMYAMIYCKKNECLVDVQDHAS